MSNVDVWTPERQAKMAEIAAAGRSAREAARELGCSRNAILGRAFRSGVRFSAPKGRPTEARQSRPRRERRCLPSAVVAQRNAALLQEYATGADPRALADKYDLSVPSIYLIARAAGIRRRPGPSQTGKRYTDNQILEAFALLAAGKSFRKVAKLLGCTEKTLMCRRRRSPDLWAKGQAIGERVRRETEAEIARKAAERARKVAEARAADQAWNRLVVRQITNPRHREILSHLIETDSLTETGKAFGVTRERVRQIAVIADALGFIRPRRGSLRGVAQ